MANTAELDLLRGDALAARGEEGAAREAWERAAATRADFVGMATTAFSERSVAAVFALRRLGRAGEARQLATALRDWAEDQRRREFEVDYFATSLPTLLLFDEDLQRRHRLTCDVIRAQAPLALDEPDEADASSRRCSPTTRASPSPWSWRVGWASPGTTRRSSAGSASARRRSIPAAVAPCQL